MKTDGDVFEGYRFVFPLTAQLHRHSIKRAEILK